MESGEYLKLRERPSKSGFTFYLKVYGTAIFSSVYISIFCERTVFLPVLTDCGPYNGLKKRFAVYFYIQVNKCVNYIQYILVNMLKGGFLLLCVGSLFGVSSGTVLSKSYKK